MLKESVCVHAVYIYTYAHICITICIYMYIYICIYVSVCIYIYIYLCFYMYVKLPVWTFQNGGMFMFLFRVVPYFALMAELRNCASSSCIFRASLVAAT